MSTMLLLLLLFAPALARRDPEEHLKVPALIRFWGYPCEDHFTTTSDGYILNLHRLPRPGARVAFLQHGLEDSSATWTLNKPNQSLAFIMYDRGFDVWMGNVRGNTYSKNHTTLPVKSDKFWAFSFDEFALIDLPTMVDYVLDHTNSAKLSYIGHSQGTMMGFVGFSQNASLADRVNSFSALAPVARITHVEGLIKFLNLAEPQIEALIRWLGVREVTVPDWMMALLVTFVCPSKSHDLCLNLMFIGCGWDISNMNQTRIPVYAGHAPAGTSTQNIIHWAQLLRDQKLQKFDFGKKENMARYNSPTPPEYDISELRVPTALFAGGNDYLADPRDVAWLEGELEEGVIRTNVFLDDYNHLDFVWGLETDERIYKRMIKFIKSQL